MIAELKRGCQLLPEKPGWNIRKKGSSLDQKSKQDYSKEINYYVYKRTQKRWEQKKYIYIIGKRLEN